MYEHRSNIEKLRSNPVVSMVDNYSVKLTADFRIQLFHLWKRNDLEGIERELERNGLGREIVGRGFSEDLIEGFKRQGFPVPREKGREDLLSQNPILQSGKFLWMENRRGIKITPEFAEELFRKYPEVSVEDGLRMAGLDPIDVGYMRLQEDLGACHREQSVNFCSGG